MIEPTNVYSLTDFQRNARKHLQRLKKSGLPEVLTVNGRAKVVVQDAKSYQEFLEAVERAQATEGIRHGLESMQRGEGRPAETALAEIRRKHKIPRDS